MCGGIIDVLGAWKVSNEFLKYVCCGKDITRFSRFDDVNFGIGTKLLVLFESTLLVFDFLSDLINTILTYSNEHVNVAAKVFMTIFTLLGFALDLFGLNIQLTAEDNDTKNRGKIIRWSTIWLEDYPMWVLSGYVLYVTMIGKLEANENYEYGTFDSVILLISTFSSIIGYSLKLGKLFGAIYDSRGVGRCCGFIFVFVAMAIMVGPIGVALISLTEYVKNNTTPPVTWSAASTLLLCELFTPFIFCPLGWYLWRVANENSSDVLKTIIELGETAEDCEVGGVAKDFETGKDGCGDGATA